MSETQEANSAHPAEICDHPTTGDRSLRDAYSLATVALRRAVEIIEAYDADEDALPGDALEDVRNCCAGMLATLGVRA